MRSPTLMLLLGSLTLSLSAWAAPPDHWSVPVQQKTLANGLTVLISEDHSSPTFGLSLVYKVGMRLEPEGRTGFAHLFEHLMFQGTPKSPKGVFNQVITAGGGQNNGSTRADFTNYIETAPITSLEAILWLEADRMRALDFNAQNLKNQQDVVKEEIRINVKNKPYGAVMWLDIAGLAFDRWANQHDGYGSFADLEHATLDDVRAFHRDFYGPNNAVLAIAGDLSAAQGFALAEKYFGSVPRRPRPATSRFDEPLNSGERRLTQTDTLAQVPALTLGWKMPARGSKDQAAMTVLAELLAGGEASRLHQALVKRHGLALKLDSGIGITGPWEYDGPTLLTVFALYKPSSNADALLAVVDEEIATIVKSGADPATLARLKTSLLASWYDGLDGFMNRADMLAKLQTLWGDARVVNQIPGWIAAVSSADLQRVAARYLGSANRVLIDRQPASAAASAAPAAPAATPSGETAKEH